MPSRVTRDRAAFLLEDYKRTQDELSPYDRAKLEAEIWRALPADIKQQAATPNGTVSIGHWFSKTFGGGIRSYLTRSYLLRRDADCEPLWRRLRDKRLTLEKARALYDEAASLAKRDGISIRSALSVTLDTYERRPVTRTLNGVPLREARTKSRKKRALTARKARPKESITKDCLRQLRDLIAALANDTLGDLSVDARETLRNELDVEVNQVLTEWSARVRRARVRAQRKRAAADTVTAAGSAISRRAYTEACRVLNITPTRSGGSVDLAAAKVAKRKLARAYHPDLSDNASTRAAYEAVIEAYDTIERYAEETSS